MTPYHNKEMRAHLYSAVKARLTKRLIKSQHERITRVVISSTLQREALEEEATQFKKDLTSGSCVSDKADKRALKGRISRVSSREFLDTKPGRRCSKEISQILVPEEATGHEQANSLPAAKRSSLGTVIQEAKTMLEIQRTSTGRLEGAAPDDIAPPIEKEEFRQLFDEVPKFAKAVDSAYRHIIKISTYCLRLNILSGEDEEKCLPTYSWGVHEEDRCTYSMAPTEETA